VKPVWRREPVVEAALATFTATLSALGVWAELAAAPWRTPPVWLAAVLTVAPNAVLVLRRRRPAAVAVAATLLVLAYHLAGFPGLAPAFSLFVAYYSAAAYARTWRWLALPAGLALASGAIPVLPPHGIAWWNPAEYGPTVGLLCMVGLGAAVRQHRLDSDAQAQAKLTEPRLSIARELHDVLAHTISVITVQGGLALDTLDDDPEQTRGCPPVSPKWTVHSHRRSS
jgi:signal transduction histidine kinase